MDALFCDELALDLLKDEDFPDALPWLEDLIEPSEKVVTQEKVDKVTKPKKAKILLPPCRVCGGSASGFHFGVITCEACKVFYRRYLRNNTPYVCAKEETCEVKPSRRGCSYCRLQKCFSLGMSKEGIQKGRYTVERKSQTILEVKLLREINRQAKEREDHFTYLTEMMLNLYIGHQAMHPSTQRQLPAFKKKYIEFNEARQSLFGVADPLAPNLHENIFRTTGMDVDNRLTSFTEGFKCGEHELMKGLRYFRQVPGFKDLCIEDKCRLLKAASVDMGLISALEAMDPEHMLLSCTVCGSTKGKFELKMLYRDRDVNPMFESVKKLKNLKLTDEELAVILPYTFFNASRCVDQLKEPELVERQRCLIKDLLHFVLVRTRGEDLSWFFTELLDALVELRAAAADRHSATQEFIQAYPEVNSTSLLFEMFGNSNAILYKEFAETS